MNLWEQANDFSGLVKPIPCPACGKNASPTIVGSHFKCEEEGHIFNQDGSPLPEGVECYCDPCRDKKKKTKESLPERVAQNCVDMFGGNEPVPIHRQVKEGIWEVRDKRDDSLMETYELPKLPNGKYMKPHKGYDVKVLKTIKDSRDGNLMKGSIAQISCSGKRVDLGLFGDGGGIVYKSDAVEGKDFEFINPKKKKTK